MKISLIFWCLWLGLGRSWSGAQTPRSHAIVENNVTSFRSVNTQPSVVQAEDGGVVIGWRSARKGLPYYNVYLQKLDSAGAPQWELDGLPLCPTASNQDNFSMVPDGYGGAIVVWEDFRFGNENPAVFAQRINLRGESLWGRDGIRLCNAKGAQRKPRIASDQENGFYVVWEDHRNGIQETDLYAQYLDLAGRIRWMENGLPIVSSPNIQQNFKMATDADHFLYLVWEDFRNGLYWNLYGQKLDNKGHYYWTAGGLDIFAGVEENHKNPALAADGYGGVLFVYQKYSDKTHGHDIYRGRIDGAGELVFHFATCFSQDDQVNPTIVKKGSKALLCWEDRRYGNWDLYAQMIRLKDGILEWEVNGVPVVKTPEDERDAVVISASSFNYQVFSWVRKEGKDSYIMVQKLNNLGEPAWGENGIVVCNSSPKQQMPSVMTDDSGGLWCAWSDRRQVGEATVYVQHIKSNTAPVLDPGGLALAGEHTSVTASIGPPVILATRSGDFYVAWEDFRNGKHNSDIYLQRFDPRGYPLWRRGGIPVCHHEGEQNRPILVDDGVGGVIVAWADSRSREGDDVYAQRVGPWGKTLWRQGGVQVCGAPSSQSQIVGISDESEGVILCWVDARSLRDSGFDLYIQRVGHDGEALWQADGKPFARFPGLQTAPALQPDGNGGAYISWMDGRETNSQIYVQHINSFGIYEWEYGGRAVARSNANQRNPQMVKNFEDDLYIIWQEGRYGDGHEKLFMQCLAPSGRKMWASQGMQVCPMYGRQSKPGVAGDDSGHLWVSWLDERSKSQSGFRLLSQKFDLSGSAVWYEGGVSIGESMVENNDYQLAIGSQGQTLYVWDQSDGAGGRSVCFQILDQGGEKSFSYSGMNFGLPNCSQTSPVVAINQDGKIMIAFREETSERHSLKFVRTQ